MKRSIVKKITVAALIICMCFSFAIGPCVITYAALPDSEIAEPHYMAITFCTADLQKLSGGLKCEGATGTSSSYTAGVQVQLQQYDGGWTTVKTWTSRGGVSASVNEIHYPESGYRYRVYTIHQAYNSSGTLVELDTMYSTEVYY